MFNRQFEPLYYEALVNVVLRQNADNAQLQRLRAYRINYPVAAEHKEEKSEVVPPSQEHKPPAPRYGLTGWCGD